MRIRCPGCNEWMDLDSTWNVCGNNVCTDCYQTAKSAIVKIDKIEKGIGYAADLRTGNGKRIRKVNGSRRSSGKTRRPVG